MIKVSGEVTLKVRYTIELKNMTAEQFDALSERQQNALIDETIDWSNELRNAETDEIEVWDVDEI